MLPRRHSAALQESLVARVEGGRCSCARVSRQGGAFVCFLFFFLNFHLLLTPGAERRGGKKCTAALASNHKLRQPRKRCVRRVWPQVKIEILYSEDAT